MTDRTALLRAIIGAGLTDPDAIRAAWADDTPRLMYADCIQDEGEHERAEFIRVQCEIANTPGLDKGWTLGDLRRIDRLKELRRRERELWGLATVVPQEWRGDFVWHRGFISRLTCSWDDWRDHAARITAEHPIEDVHSTTSPLYFHRDPDNGEWVDLISSPRLAWSHMDDWKQFRRVAAERWPAITFHLPQPERSGRYNTTEPPAATRPQSRG